MSHLLPICAKTIPEMDVGLVGREIDRQIATIMKDISDRPCDAAGKTHKRSLCINIDFTPEVDVNALAGTRHITKINVEPTIKGMLPATKGSLTDVRIVRGQAMFNRDSPNEFTQQTLEYDAEDVLDK